MSLALRFSLGANLVLAGIIAVLFWRGPSAPGHSADAARSPSRQADVPKARGESQLLQRPGGGSTLSADAVAKIEKMGVSHETLVNLVLEELNRRSAKKVLALQKKYAPRLVPDREMRELVRQNEEEQIRAMKETFGEEGYREWDKEQTLHNLNRARPPGDEVPLSADESEQAYRLQKAFDDKFRDLQQAVEDGDADKVEAGMLQAQAQQNLDQELMKLLGKERFDALRGNADPTVQVFRDYGDLNPTRTQAEAVVHADEDYRSRYEALAKQMNDNPGSTADLMAQMKALSDAHDESMRQIFGAAAYDNLKQQNDPTYQSLKQFADVWELSAQDVQSTYATLHAFEDQADRLRNAAEMSEAAGQRVNWHEINATIEQQRQQVESSLKNQIGDTRLQRLQANGLLAPR